MTDLRLRATDITAFKEALKILALRKAQRRFTASEVRMA
jgi:hypothetical protein